MATGPSQPPQREYVAPSERPSGLLVLLKRRYFRRMWAVTTVSSLGDWLGVFALVVEDSGFLTAGIYLLYPALGFATGYADRALLGARHGSAAASDEPPNDADDQDRGNHDARQGE